MCALHSLLSWAGVSKHRRATDSRDVAHSLPPCCLGQMRGRAERQKQSSRREPQLSCPSRTDGKQACACATELGWYLSPLTEDVLGQAKLHSVTARRVWCWKDTGEAEWVCNEATRSPGIHVFSVRWWQLSLAVTAGPLVKQTGRRFPTGGQ